MWLTIEFSNNLYAPLILQTHKSNLLCSLQFNLNFCHSLSLSSHMDAVKNQTKFEEKMYIFFVMVFFRRRLLSHIDCRCNLYMQGNKICNDSCNIKRISVTRVQAPKKSTDDYIQSEHNMYCYWNIMPNPDY